MNKYLKCDEWKIIEEGFNKANVMSSESIFSIGNGRMGQRANFEEDYSGESLQGTYVAGVYYPDKTKVGWWKNGYPEYFAKVLNATNWIGLRIGLNNESLDLDKVEVSNFRRELNMYTSLLSRSFTAKMIGGSSVSVHVQRFLSIVDDDLGVVKYSIKSIDFAGELSITSYVDGDVKNEDSNYDEKFWDEISHAASGNESSVTVKTKKTGFVVNTSARFEVWKNGERLDISTESLTKSKYAENKCVFTIGIGDEVVIYKFAAIVSSFNHNDSELESFAIRGLNTACSKHFDLMFEEQAMAWADKWEESDIVIKGDVEAQQGIRFNIFHLNQTYTGEDERLNIGPKGFTGEKYGGTTYWDTEAYCLPFFLATADQSVARQLLKYRYKQLGKAIENGEKLGFTNGAALFPMVTANGEECHNEWEITFEEIHRNGAIAFAVYNYIRHTGDKEYLVKYGLELLIAISRFWSQRITYSQKLNKYVMLGVTGPNEYENNVDNNWYTNTIAHWCLEYTLEVIEYVKTVGAGTYKLLVDKISFNESEEVSKWKDIISNMHFPEDKELGIFVQQDNYLNKEQILVKDLDKDHRPINQKWSWDRILRSCFIKQADTLQGIYLFEDRYDVDIIRKNFDFYESRTVHESSLSPCVHVVLAAKLDKMDKAYELYLRTSRLDLDDYNDEVAEGLHITSMAGTWMSVVQGFGGMRVLDNKLHLSPKLPEAWDSYSFTIRFRLSILKVTATKDTIDIVNKSCVDADIYVFGQPLVIEGSGYAVYNR